MENRIPLQIKTGMTISEVTQLCLTLCDPMDYSPPGSFIHGRKSTGVGCLLSIKSASGYLSKGNKNTNSKRYMHPCATLCSL